MSRSKFILLLFCVYFVACKSDPASTDLEKLKLFGKVKNITEIYFLPVMSDDTIKRGEQTASESSFFESRGEEAFLSYETKIYFGQNGKTAEFTMSDPASELNFKETYEYTNNVLKTKTGLLSGKFFYKEVFEYDSKNRETERIFYDGENHIFETIVVEYPHKDSIVEKVFVPENTDPAFERISYLVKDKPTILLTKMEGTQIEKWVAEYDEKGRVIGSTIYDDLNEIMQFTTNKYDSIGNELEFLMYTHDKQLIATYKYQYIYDKHNNWVQQVTIVNNYPEIITVREISYYD